MKLSLSLGLLFVCAGASFAQTFTGAGFTFQDATDDDFGLSFSTTTVSGLDASATIESITLTGLTHTWIGDTVFELVRESDGAFIDFISPPNGRDANFDGTYVLVPSTTLPTIDEVTTGQGSSFNVPSGTYAMSDFGGGTDNGPRIDFSEFDGADLNGDWSLLVGDFGVGDTGAIGSWSINFASNPVPEPATMAVLGLGAAALLRRRRRG